jgi:hypothetical protein
MKTFWRDVLSPSSALKMEIACFSEMASTREFIQKHWHRSASPHNTKIQIIIITTTVKTKNIHVAIFCMLFSSVLGI